MNRSKALPLRLAALALLAALLCAARVAPTWCAATAATGPVVNVFAGEATPTPSPEPEPSEEPTPAPSSAPEPSEQPTPVPSREPAPSPDATAEPGPTAAPEQTAEPARQPDDSPAPTQQPAPAEAEGGGTGAARPAQTGDPFTPALWLALMALAAAGLPAAALARRHGRGQTENAPGANGRRGRKQR